MSKPQEIVDEEHEQVIERVAAIDVARASGMVCVRVPHESVPGRRASRVWEVAATTRAVTELGDHLACQGIEKVTVESTSDYWRIWFYLLEAAGLDVQLVNARQARHLPGRPKTDKLDSVWQAKCTERGMLRPSFVPPPEIRELREWSARSEARTYDVDGRRVTAILGDEVGPEPIHNQGLQDRQLGPELTRKWGRNSPAKPGGGMSSLDHRDGEGGQRNIDLVQGKCGWVEVIGGVEPQPFQAFFVVLVCRVGEDLQEVAVSPDATAVLRWAGAPAGEAAGIGNAWLDIGDGFDDNVMFPVVTEVVGVVELRTGAWGNLAESLRRRAADIQVTVGDPVPCAWGLEDPHVVVLPAEGGLDDVVQFFESAARGHLHAAPNRRPGVPQSDLDCVNGPPGSGVRARLRAPGVGHGGHPATNPELTPSVADLSIAAAARQARTMMGCGPSDRLSWIRELCQSADGRAGK